MPASPPPRLLIIDSRSPAEPPLREILGHAGVNHEVHLAPSLEAAAEILAASSPVAVFIHAGFGTAPGASGSGTLLGALTMRRYPDLPLLLHTGDVPGNAREVARLGLAWPVVSDKRLAASFEAIVSNLRVYGAATAALRRAARDAPVEAKALLPEGFRIERWLGQVERALLLAAMREYQSRSLTDAAAALCMPVSTFYTHVQLHALELPNLDGPFFDAEDTLLWCSPAPAPSWLDEGCAAAGARVKGVQPGALHPRTTISTAMLAAVVDPTEASSAVDAWLLDHYVRPFVVQGPISTPVRLLLDELSVGCRTAGSVALVRDLLAAGRATVRLYEDVPPDIRRGFRADGRPAWPIDLPDLLSKLDSCILSVAASTTPSLAAAARAVGLAETTYRSRLRKAEQRY